MYKGLRSEAKRLRLQSLARMFTGRNNLIVRLHPTNSYTDFTTMSIADDDMGGQGSPAMRWLSRKASVAHEAGHFLYTHKGDWKKAVREGDLVANIFNMLEDGRIERLVANAFPGTLLWFRVVNEFHFRELPETGCDVANLLNAIAAYAKAGIIHPLSGRGEGIFGDCRALVDKAIMYRTSATVLKVSQQIAELITAIFPIVEAPSPSTPKGTSKPEKAPTGKKDHRRIRVIEREPEQQTSDATNNEEGSEESENTASVEQTREEDVGGDVGTDTGTGTDTDADTDTGTGTDTNTGTGTDTDINTSTEDKASTSNSEITSSIENEAFDDEALSVLSDAAREIESLEAAAKRDASLEQEDFNVPMSEIEEKVSVGIHAGIRLKVTKSEKPSQIIHDKYKKMVQETRGLARQVVDEIKMSLEYRPTILRRNLRRGRIHTNSLYKIATCNGRVFSRYDQPGDIPELAVYCLVDCSTSMRRVAQGESKVKIALAQEGATMLHQACVELKIPHKVVGFNACSPDVWHQEVVPWGEDSGVRIATLFPSGYNRDGYSLRVAAEELLARPEPDKLIISLSDGMPNDKTNYDNLTVGPADTMRTTRAIERMGIQVVCIYFGSDNHLERAHRIYNNLVFAQSQAQIPAILGRVLRKIYT